MDMWSMACSMFEMYTAKVLFPGRHNNEVLKQVMDLRGHFPRRLLKKVGGYVWVGRRGKRREREGKRA